MGILEDTAVTGHIHRMEPECLRALVKRIRTDSERPGKLDSQERRRAFGLSEKICPERHEEV